MEELGSTAGEYGVIFSSALRTNASFSPTGAT